MMLINLNLNLKVRVGTRGGSDDVWGTVTFRLPEQAELAVNHGYEGGRAIHEYCLL